ncbi:MAG: hypothetical protein JWQ60_4636 [Pseudonocardia sp.]|nr:hypothetical protein [Pseudonocardia sp.]
MRCQARSRPLAVGSGRYARSMTAAAHVPEPGSGRAPFADASPARVRAALIPEDVAEFDRQWRAVMAAATESLDLAEVHRTLESWLISARGHDGYRGLLADAERRTRTGERAPGAVSWEELRTQLGA